MTVLWALCAIFAAAVTIGIVLALVLRQRAVPLVVAAAGSVASAALAAFGVIVLLRTLPVRVALWSLPPIGNLSISVDHTGALFLIVAGVVFFPVSIFAKGYIDRYSPHYSLRPMAIFFLGLLPAIAVIFAAGDMVVFLLAWEIMTIFAFLLVAFEYERRESTSAAFLYFAMSESGMVAATVAFLILAVNAGSTNFEAMRAAAPHLGAGARWAVFVLSFFGFGVKAGIVPVNTWLPRAHPEAPANVSAVLSGTILNLGLYGMLKVNIDILPVSTYGPGLVVLAVGGITAFIGILYASVEDDLKGLLAHSSIENIGIVVAGFGAAMVFIAAGRTGLAAMSLTAALYHMGNHSVYKSLLFMGAGSVDVGAGTRDLDRLGGLARSMPLTTLFFLVGALAISAMPPLNGFVSEWLTLQGLLRAAELKVLGVEIVFVVVGVLLALTAALAITCFLKAFGMGFLGRARTEPAARAREKRGVSILALGTPALLCLVLGVLPTYVIPAIDRAVSPLVSSSASTELVPPFFDPHGYPGGLPDDFVRDFHAIGAQVGKGVLPGRGLVVLHRGGSDAHVVFAMSTSYLVVVLLLIIGMTALIVATVRRKRTVTHERPWDGGLRRYLPGMTYTATGFAAPISVVFRSIFRPTVVEASRRVEGLQFREAIERRTEQVHIVRRTFLDPLIESMRKVSRLLARIHNGRINTYVIYVLLALIIVLVIW